MMKRLFHSHASLTICLFAAMLFLARPAAAQDGHPITVGASYTWLRTNLLPGCNCFGMNGGSAELQYGLRPRWSAVAELTAAHRGGISAGNYDLTQFIYSGGLRYKPLSLAGKLQPFGEILLGGAHASGTLSPLNTLGASSNAFAFQTGGGIDLRLNKRWTLTPARVDYLLTTFTIGAEDHQNQFRYSAGVRFTIHP
jgi:outer membrane immunogenic protein